MAETYKIEGEELTLSAVVQKCEDLARGDGTRYFVGRDTIRGRLRKGVRTWDELTARVMTHRERAARSPWKRNSPTRGGGA